MQDCPEAKKPCKGILKTSSSFDKTGASFRKSAKFDELNVLQTLHPADKDYGHMKIDEPKTPYNYADPAAPDQLDAELLAEKLTIAANTQSPSFGDEDLSDEDFPETEEEKVRRQEFEKRRKKHYNEYEAVRLARKLIREELGDEEEEITVDDESTIPSRDSFVTQQGEHFEEEVESRKISSDRSTTSTEIPTLPTQRSTELDVSHPCYGRTSAAD